MNKKLIILIIILLFNKTIILKSTECKISSEIAQTKNDPLSKLGFQKINNSYGWLKIEEPEAIIGDDIWPAYKDYVFIKVNKFANGYSIEFIDSEFNKLPKGLFFWKNSKKIRPYHNSQDNYVKKEDNYWYKERTYKFKPEVWREKNYDNDLQALLETAFNNKSFFYIDAKENTEIPLGPDNIKFRQELINKGILQYNDLEQKHKEQLLSFITDNYLKIINNLLNEKLKDSGLENLDEVINQFIIEEIMMLTRIFITDKSGYEVLDVKATKTLDLSKLIKDILDLEVGVGEEREAFNKHMQGLPEKRQKGITAKGSIICCPGLLQWD